MKLRNLDDIHALIIVYNTHTAMRCLQSIIKLPILNSLEIYRSNTIEKKNQ